MQQELRNLYRMFEDIVMHGLNETDHEVMDSEFIWGPDEVILTVVWECRLSGDPSFRLRPLMRE